MHTDGETMLGTKREWLCNAMRRIANDYDRLARLPRSNSPIRKDGSLTPLRNGSRLIIVAVLLWLLMVMAISELELRTIS
jgi:hypothetical protein